MSARFRILVVVTVAIVVFGACRRDGPMPMLDEETDNRVGDVGRDLTAVARGEAQARQDLADDLIVFVGNGVDARQSVDNLAQLLADTLSGKMLSDEQARVLAEDLWKSAAATELSGRQIEALIADVQAHLVEIGVSNDGAQAVASQVGVVQQAVNRPRRWYELF